jgi:hypothetical protein
MYFNARPNGTTEGMAFQINGNTDMFLRRDGNLGIGTTDPTSLLSVNDGNIKIVKSMLSGGTDFDFLQLSFNGGWSGNVGGLAAINFTDSITASNTVGRIGVTYTGTQGKFAITDLYSGGYGASGDVFTTQADGQTYIKGNLGIGTTSPSDRLSVYNGTYAVNIGSYSASWVGNTIYPTIYSSAADKWIMITSPHVPYLENGVDGYSGSTSGARIRFASNSGSSNVVAWDAGIPHYGGVDTFTIGRNGVAFVKVESDGAVRISETAQELVTLSNVAMAVGSNATGGQIRFQPQSDNAVDLGSSGVRWDDIYATNPTINTSDRNEKNTIKETDLGLDFINKLKPVSYIWNNKTRTHYGLIAQDVEDLLSEINKDTKDFAGFIKADVSEEKDNIKHSYGLRYNEFISPMIKAIQELKADNDSLKARIKTLENK